METYDLIIIGGGPAGAAAGVYAARKQLRSALIAKEFGGQSIVSPDIQNWIGTPSISGTDLAKTLKTHVETYAGEYLDVVEGDEITNVEKVDGGFSVTAGKNTYIGKTLLVTLGADRRKLDVPGAAEFDQKGLTYCASCDGPLFSGADVVVVGGGNAGFETASQLLAYVKSVTLLEYCEEFKADAITVKKVLEKEHMTALANTEVLEILGDKLVTGVRYKDRLTNEEKELPVTGVFVEIGLIPNTKLFEGLLKLDQHKRIVIDHKNQTTSIEGVWAAGDCTDGLYHQNNIAAGDAVKALEDIYNYLHTR